ncbi:nuclear transport factor 2 family protein [Croceibacterium salegens]|nr:nuclear transport factor 2 family protein [Croceibacterium salegens]
MHRIAIAIAAALALAACSQPGSEAADRAAIHDLLMDYGKTIDARDFDGFAALFASDGVYVGGAGGETRGTEAGAAMKQTFAENALGFGELNFHVFFNEQVELTGPDSATATSKSFFMVPGEDGAPKPALMAEYHDTIVRQDGKWKFSRREVHGLLPAPARR